MSRRVLVFGRLACYVTGMGHVYQRVKLAAVNEEDLNILVDTGATLSLIPPALADRPGIARFPRKQVIVLAAGRRIEADAGVVMVEIGDRKAVSTVVIADCDEPLLGVETLETLGLAVDPTTGSLTPTRSFTVRLGAVIIWPGEDLVTDDGAQLVVVELAGLEERPALQRHDAEAGGGELLEHSPATRAGADHADVEVVMRRHAIPLSWLSSAQNFAVSRLSWSQDGQPDSPAMQR